MPAARAGWCSTCPAGRAAPRSFAGDLANYRRYAVNHEVGHALGHNHAHECLRNGLAPVMMQQTIGTKTASGPACRVNPWPFPPGVAGRARCRAGRRRG